MILFLPLVFVFHCKILQDLVFSFDILRFLARSCDILQDFARFTTIYIQVPQLCCSLWLNILQDIARCRVFHILFAFAFAILQDLARS
jgi:hypothetical protein